ncbi:MAG: SRPBCC family protein, partial [Burkholderiales bacterium]
MRCALLALTLACGPALADVSVERNGASVVVQADLQVAATPGEVWAVLTDYAHLADFVPDMHSSLLLKRSGKHAVVKQKGESGFFIFRFPIEVTLEVT